MEDKLVQYSKEDDEIAKKILIATKLAFEKKSEAMQKRAVLLSLQQDRNEGCSNINALVGQACPTCKRPVPHDEAESLLAGWDGDLQNISDGLVVLESEISQIDRLESMAVATLNTNKSLLRQEISNLQAQQRLLHSKIQQRDAALQLICQLEQQVFNISDRIDQLALEQNPYTQMVDEANTELVTLQRKYQKLSYRQKALDLNAQHLLFWDKGFGNHGIKSFVIEGVIPFLNERAQHYADILSGGDLRIEFSAQKQLKSGQSREEFQVRVHNQQGAEVYKGNSAGERRRIDTAVGWALGDLAATRAKKPIRFKGLDEPFESLDETGEDAIIKLLYAVLPQYETIMCITHSDHLRNQFPRTLTVVKEGGCSHVNLV